MLDCIRMLRFYSAFLLTEIQKTYPYYHTPSPEFGYGWGGVHFISIYLNPLAVFSLPFPLPFDFDLLTSAIAS